MNANSGKPQQINGLDLPASSVRDGSGVNGSGTYLKSGTPLTRDGSRDVRRGLIALRVKYGADTAIGHRCSNIVELLKLEKPTDQIERQMRELEALLVDIRR